MADQRELPLVFRVRDVLAGEGKQLLKIVTEVVENAGLKSVADAIGVDPAHLSNALNGRGKQFSVKWLFVVMMADKDQRILRFICRATGNRPPQPAIELTPEELWQRTQSVLRRNGRAGLVLLSEILDDDGDGRGGTNGP